MPVSIQYDFLHETNFYIHHSSYSLMESFDFDKVMEELQKSLKPYKNNSKEYRKIPDTGIDGNDILGTLTKYSTEENRQWKAGRVSGAVYHGGSDLLDFLDRVYSVYSQSNPLHPDVWPSLTKFETEIVSMCARIMNGNESTRGVVSSGGTESILLAMKAYRDYYRKVKGITEPEIILPVSAHAAFLKACDYFCMKPVFVDLDENYIADIEKVKSAITKNTVAIVGSMPNFPYGTFDPVKEMSEIARDHGIGMHVDACLGGFIIPWAEKSGYPLPPFDFRLEGVTSISMDTHKYGFAPKGTSVVLYKNSELFQNQLYATGTWKGGIYFTPTMAGSRPGYPIVAAWAVMLLMGSSGYQKSSKSILDTGKYIIGEVRKIPELKLMGNPLWVVALTSDAINPYSLMAEMGKKGWMLSGLANPPAFHIALTMRQTDPGVKEAYVRDLQESVRLMKGGEGKASGLAPVYGMASAMPREAVDLFLTNIVEWLYS